MAIATNEKKGLAMGSSPVYPPVPLSKMLLPAAMFMPILI
jgi:hypothetical protein